MSENQQPRAEFDAPDPGALVVADLAWMETNGSLADRTKAAIQAYLWAVKVADVTGLYPSLNDWRARATPPEGGEA